MSNLEQYTRYLEGWMNGAANLNTPENFIKTIYYIHGWRDGWEALEEAKRIASEKYLESE